MALRKLNTSYGKRTKELERERRERREEREGWRVQREGWEEEREEGWKVAVEVGGRLDGERAMWEVERGEWEKEKEGWEVEKRKWEKEREGWGRERGGWEMERREWEDEKGWWIGERRKWEKERKELLERVEATSTSADVPAVEEVPSTPRPPKHLDASAQTDPLTLIAVPTPQLDSAPAHANTNLHAPLQRNDSDSWESTIDGHSFRDNASINTQDHEVVGVMGTAVASKARLTMVSSPRLGDFGEQQGQGGAVGHDNNPLPPPPKSSVPPSSYPSTGTNVSQDSSPVGPNTTPTTTTKHDRRLSGSSQVSQVSLVSAARKRSMRASKASLRIPARVTAKVNARSPTTTIGDATSPVSPQVMNDSPTLGSGGLAGLSGSPVVQSSLWNNSASSSGGGDGKEGGDGDEVKSVRTRRARSRSRSHSKADISRRPSTSVQGKGHGRGRSRAGSLGGISASEMPPLPGATGSVNGEGNCVGGGGGKERERVVSVDGVHMKGKGKSDMDGEGDSEEDGEDTYMSFLELGGRALELESELGKGGAEKEVSGTLSAPLIFRVLPSISPYPSDAC